jgi:hypothetical protein
MSQMQTLSNAQMYFTIKFLNALRHLKNSIRAPRLKHLFILRVIIALAALVHYILYSIYCKPITISPYSFDCLKRFSTFYNFQFADCRSYRLLLVFLNIYYFAEQL